MAEDAGALTEAVVEDLEIADVEGAEEDLEETEVVAVEVTEIVEVAGDLEIVEDAVDQEVVVAAGDSGIEEDVVDLETVEERTGQSTMLVHVI